MSGTLLGSVQLSTQAGAFVAAVLVGGGLALAVVAAIMRVRTKQRTLAEILDDTMGTAQVPVEVVSESPERGELSAVTVRIAGIFGRMDTSGALEQRLERAAIPLRSGEYIVITAAIAGMQKNGAGFAGFATGVLGRHYLREALWLGQVFLVTAGAQHFGVRQHGCHRARIVGVCGQGTMAAFAVDAGVLAHLLHVQHVGMALLAGLMARVVDGFCRQLGQRVTAVVSVLPEALGNEVRPHQQKDHQHNGRCHRQPDNVFGVLKCSQAHPMQAAAWLLGGLLSQREICHHGKIFGDN